MSRRYSRTVNKNLRREADIGVQDVEAVSKQFQVAAEAGNRMSYPRSTCSMRRESKMKSFPHLGSFAYKMKGTAPTFNR